MSLGLALLIGLPAAAVGGWCSGEIMYRLSKRRRKPPLEIDQDTLRKAAEREP